MSYSYSYTVIVILKILLLLLQCDQQPKYNVLLQCYQHPKYSFPTTAMLPKPQIVVSLFSFKKDTILSLKFYMYIFSYQYNVTNTMRMIFLPLQCYRCQINSLPIVTLPVTNTANTLFTIPLCFCIVSVRLCHRLYKWIHWKDKMMSLPLLSMNPKTELHTELSALPSDTKDVGCFVTICYNCYAVIDWSNVGIFMYSLYVTGTSH